MTLAPGTRLGPYEILSALGAGGMGEVYRARDTRLQRTVAIKLIRSEHADDPGFRDRFQREARAISALNHPHICSLYDIGEHQGVDYLVMEYVEGRTLAQVLKQGPLPVELALRYGAEIANALVAVHARGIIHRDLKPGNVMVTESGVKVLDFGLTKSTEHAHRLDALTVTAEPATSRGHVLGTVEYMSPEQAEGRALDARSDIFSFGVLLYEMLCGQRPFHGESTLSTLASILREAPTPVRSLRPGISDDVDRIVSRCLAKRAEDRYDTARDLEQDLKQLIREPSSGVRVSRPLVVIAAALVVVAVGAAGTWQYSRYSRVRWAETEAIPRAEQLLEHDQPIAALKLLREVETRAPSAAGLSRLKEDIHLRPSNIQTEPSGADIYVVDYSDPDVGDPQHWEYVGKSPVRNLLLPQGAQVRLRIVKDTFEPLELAYLPAGNLPPLQLHTRRDTPSVPSAMVWVAPGGARNPIGLDLPLPASSAWIDKYEVTNREFKKFVDAGGYRKREYWTHPFITNGKPLSFEEALVSFRDMTGSPGPSTWEGGTYPDGMDEYPVSGVSWYEAAAYAEFEHKSLPTVSHWYRAAGLGVSSQIVQMSNFTGKGPTKAGERRGLTPSGTFDQAGNVKEWVLNATGDKRFILGGGWNEPSYMHAVPDARGPFERDGTFGFRCAVYVGAVPGALTAPLPPPGLEAVRQPPVNDQTFAGFKSQLFYDKSDLDARVELENDAPHWRRQKISFQAPYGDGTDRVILHLYLPKSAVPRYQTVLYFGGGNMLTARTADEVATRTMDYIVKSGRALALPAYAGTLERGPSGFNTPIGQRRDQTLKRVKDFSRTIDYLASRDDIDMSKIGFYGVSFGAGQMTLALPVEPRVRVAVLASVGVGRGGIDFPEADYWNYIPRVRIPVLMLNGRDDVLFPVEQSQKVYYKTLGSAEKDKRYVVYPGGHVDFNDKLEVIKEALSWLDRYLGPVKRQ